MGEEFAIQHFMLEKLFEIFCRLMFVDCAGCGSLVVHAKGLCLSCEYHIVDRYLISSNEVQYLQDKKFKFRYLFRWVPGESNILSNYVHVLKSPLAKPFWKELAKLFIDFHSLKNPDIVFVPIPSSGGRKHSVYFADALAKRLQGKMILALDVVASDVEQKQRSKSERQKVKFAFNEEFTEILQSAQTIVLVDDVITTGSSFQAAYNALKVGRVLPENIELWTAFHRESTLVLTE